MERLTDFSTKLMKHKPLLVGRTVVGAVEQLSGPAWPHLQHAVKQSTDQEKKNVATLIIVNPFNGSVSCSWSVNDSKHILNQTLGPFEVIMLDIEVAPPDTVESYSL